MEAKPKCPEHPNSLVVDARIPASDTREWVCIVCAKKLGAAPSREAEWEPMTLERDIPEE